jgi:hypothetical protein
MPLAAQSRAARLTLRGISVAFALLMLAATIVLGTGSSPALAAAKQSPPYYVVLDAVAYPKPTAANLGHGCSAALYSAQVAKGKPAYVSEIGSNIEAGVPCTFMLERSANKGKTWDVIAPRVTLTPVTGVIVDTKTPYYDDGPGYEARACFTYSTAKTPHCGAVLRLANGSGKPPAESEKVVYGKGAEAFAPGAGFCGSALFGTTEAKKASSQAVADVIGLSLAAPCSMYVQESANNGKTWATVSPTYKLPVTGFSEIASYSANYSDGPSRIARACVAIGSAKPVCTAAW